MEGKVLVSSHTTVQNTLRSPIAQPAELSKYDSADGLGPHRSAQSTVVFIPMRHCDCQPYRAGQRALEIPKLTTRIFFLIRFPHPSTIAGGAPAGWQDR